MLRNIDLSIVRATCRSLFTIGLAALAASKSFAQADGARRQALCSADQAAIDQLSRSLSHVVLWDDPALARAQNSLAELRRSKASVIRLTRRLNGVDEWAANAEAFDKTSEANLWRRNAAQVRAAIAAENKKAKSLAAVVGVSCPGCAYSILIAKVEAAINAAVSARSQAAQARQQIVAYRENMFAAGCRE